MRDCGIGAISIAGVVLEVGIKPTVRHGQTWAFCLCTLPMLVVLKLQVKRLEAMRGAARIEILHSSIGGQLGVGSYASSRRGPIVDINSDFPYTVGDICQNPLASSNRSSSPLS